MEQGSIGCRTVEFENLNRGSLVEGSSEWESNRGRLSKGIRSSSLFFRARLKLFRKLL